MQHDVPQKYELRKVFVVNKLNGIVIGGLISSCLQWNKLLIEKKKNYEQTSFAAQSMQKKLRPV